MVAAMHADQTTTSNPIINIDNRVENSDPVKDHRDYGSSSIIYSKGGTVLGMIRCALGDRVFFDGLSEYLEDYKYSSTTSDQLYDSWQNFIKNENIEIESKYSSNQNAMCGELGKNKNDFTFLPEDTSVEEVWDTWTRQMGYPFIRVNTVKQDNEMKLVMSQKRFLNNPDEDLTKPDSNLKYLWYIPLAIQTKNNFYSFWMTNTDQDQTFLIESSNFTVVNYQYRYCNRHYMILMV